MWQFNSHDQLFLTFDFCGPHWKPQTPNPFLQFEPAAIYTQIS
jgi:hypothetical protein